MNLQDTLKEIITFSKTQKPAIVLLQGDLGAGKTHLVQHLARELGIKEQVISPTFTILKSYLIPDTEAQLVHIDLYRMLNKDIHETLEQISFWDYMTNDNIICIEWPAPIMGLVDSLQPLIINITIKEHGERNYTFLV